MTITHWLMAGMGLLAATLALILMVAAAQDGADGLRAVFGRHGRLIGAILGLCLVVGVLSGISTLQKRMIALRDTHELTEGAVLENAPPVVAFVQVALGGFRGLLADFLFLRSQKVQDKENFFELVQLADWIVKLQPRFTGAIAFLGWNMSYNVSVIFSDCRDRWRWVQRGIELMRDEALDYHPGDPKLYKELGWLYQHKVGQILDDCNRYYKAQLAMQMIEILGNAPRFRWAWLAAGADDVEALNARLGPEAEKLQEILDGAGMTFDRLEHDFRATAAFPVGVREQLQALPSVDELDRCLRKRWLRDRLKLDAGYIAKLIEKYGYLDFRLPEAHAIYWASKGLDCAENNVNLDCERMIFQSMKDAFVRGRLLYLTADSVPFMGPNIAVVDSVRKAYLDAALNHENNSSIMSGYENFMKDAVVIMYTAGYRAKADQFLRYLRETPRFANKKDYHQRVDDFALKELAEDISGKSTFQVQAIIGQMLWRANFLFALGESDRAAGVVWLAEQVYTQYAKDVSTNERSKMRRGFESFAIIKRELTKACLRGFHPELRAMLTTALRQSGQDVDQLLREIKKEDQSRNLLDASQAPDMPLQRQ